MQRGQLSEDVEDLLKLVRWLDVKDQTRIAANIRRALVNIENEQTMTKTEIETLRGMRLEQSKKRFEETLARLRKRWEE